MKRKYKTLHSSDKTHKVYRRFHYTPRIRLDILTAVALALAVIGIYIIIPTPSDAVEVAAMSGFLISVFDISFKASLIYALAIYKALGEVLLAAGLLFGGIVVRNMIERRVSDIVDRIKT